jgi:di/tricarboxylate transporter
LCERLRDVRLRFGDVLLVQGPHDSLRGLQSSPELLVVEPRELEPLKRDKAGLALTIALGTVLAAATETVPILVSALAGVVLVIATGILRPREIYRVIRWDIIFLLAGLMPLGTAMEKSGATDWLASQLTQVGGHLSGFWLLVLFYGVTTLLTEALSNNAAVLLMLPIAVKVAETLEFYTLPFMLVVMFAASNSYLTPIGYQTNTMVYGPGGYKFLDFTRVGIPLNLILTFLVPLMSIWFYGLNLSH